MILGFGAPLAFLKPTSRKGGEYIHTGEEGKTDAAPQLWLRQPDTG